MSTQDHRTVDSTAFTRILSADDPALLHAGRRIELTPAGVTIGRTREADLVVDADRVSRRHARVEDTGSGWVVTDLGSTNGTHVNGVRVTGSHPLRSGDEIVIGGESIRFVGGQATRIAGQRVAVQAVQELRVDGPRVTIGRDPSCDLVLEDPNVSRLHAELLVDGDAVELRDLGSTNGSYVDGRRMRSAAIDRTSEIHIGPFRIVLDNGTLVARDERGLLRIDARDVAVDVKRKRILQPTSLTVEPGRFVGIIGESGAGKTTLMKGLAGVEPFTGGRVAVNGEPLDVHRTSIGYVPQQEITHGRLKVIEALRYSARLRLPPDARPEEVEAVCERVLGELSLAEHAQTRVDRLSGGQRRRVGVATELLNRPSLLFLDEPTTGLDPGLEARMMQLLRDLADGSRTVVLVTHGTASLSMCDEVIVMGRGGHLCFQGPPDAALAFFGATRFEDVYGKLEERPAEEWRARFAELATAPEALPALPAPAEEPAGPAPRPLGRQIRVLAARYATLFVRDRRNALILLGQVPLIALACAGLFGGDVFAPTTRSGESTQLLFLMVTVAVWLGAIDAAREVIKERSVLQRETAIGVRLTAYLASKLVVLWSLIVVQVVILAGIVLLLRPLHDDASAYAGLFVTLLLTGFASVAMGLLVSAAADSQDQATSFVPLVLIPQLFFAGAIIPVSKMSAPIEAISQVVFAKWSFATSGSAIGMDERIRTFPEGFRYAGFFDLQVLAGVLVLVAFVAAFLVLAWLLLRRAAIARR